MHAVIVCVSGHATRKYRARGQLGQIPHKYKGLLEALTFIDEPWTMPQFQYVRENFHYEKANFQNAQRNRLGKN